MPTQVPLIDLRAQYQSIRSEINAAIQCVLDSGQFILGPEVRQFEQEIAAFCDCKHAVAVASGTDALELALRAYGVKQGDEVITTAFSFFATAGAILATGALPVFVDIEPDTYNLSVSQIKKAITPKTKAIIPVHLYGYPAPMEDLMRLAKAHDLRVIEDAAQAIGAEVQGKRVGGLGDAGAFSFFPTKNLGGYGDGGIVVTNDDRAAAQIRLLRAHGSPEKYQHVQIGTNSRLDEIQAAILRVKLRHIDSWNQARRRNAHTYNEAFAAARLTDIILPFEHAGYRHVYHLYCVRTEQRDRLQKALTQAGIATQIAYPGTIPSQPALSSLASAQERFPNAENAARQVLALPMYPELSAEAVQQVVAAIGQWVQTVRLPASK